MPVSKRRKTQKKGTAVEKAMDQAMERFIAYQSETADRFFKWEEKQREIEEKAEERRRKEDREHELRMLQMLGQMIQASRPTTDSPGSSRYYDMYPPSYSDNQLREW